MVPSSSNSLESYNSSSFQLLTMMHQVEHMTGNVSCYAILLRNTWGIVRFGNDQFAYFLAMRFDSGNITIKKGLLLRRMEHRSLKEIFTMIQRNLQALVIFVRTDRGTEFLNKTLNAFFKEEGIEIKTLPSNTERTALSKDENRTLVEVCFSKLMLFSICLAITALYTLLGRECAV
ncbi:retrovirus-related pol polyprotein from transposon TNT 1-94 [Tanacetum coccineum]